MSLKISKTEFKKDVMDNCRRLFVRNLMRTILLGGSISQYRMQ